MGQILKFPVRAAKFGYKRVPKRGREENPGQLHLFAQASAQVLQFTPDSSHFEYALLLDERGDARAAELYLKAIAAQDCTADAYCNLGILESKQGRIPKAFDCFTNCLKHDPRHFEAHYNLGNLYFEVNDLRLAQVHYELATEVDPAFPNVYFNLALVLSMKNEFAAAISALTKYQEIVPIEEARNADELLDNLKRSLAAAKNFQTGVT
ncbi:MAG TPA: tetratricopeptide repeat protein [Verrucomicrobiae bacterium]|nr:tetratricopeptide repeat protein [Verrucomicrobiae bacterium]